MSETRQVKWVEEPFTLIGRNKFYPNDVTTMDKEEADQYIAAGLCECTKTGEIGVRKPGHVALHVNDASLAMQ